MNDDKMSVKEAAVALNVCEKTTREYLKIGYIRGIKLPKKWLVPRVEVERFLSEGIPASTTTA